ncbi:uncharacterized protein UTRI_05223_B [Ustilago trichophora]|uniref:Uncharacterized protein n=1 Tax=Ustilago trichophora TaxID=86804 RepID=A0A5C3EKZ7_9BASI|nr:uncharacterized protein UTRI_05223_B [Ustilago trichophora]
MAPPLNTTQATAGPSHLSAPYHVSGSTGTSTRNRINASLAKQHFVLHPTTVAEPSKPLFDAVPRNAEYESLRPILARLPDDEDDHVEQETESLDYVLKRGVMYTRSPLPFLDSASIDLWKSLHHFRPLTADYASGYLDPTPPHPLPPNASFTSCPVFSSATSKGLSQLRSSFNWASLPPLPLATFRIWYGFLFLSVRKTDSESLSFYEADRLAHEEATRSGGLIMYWYGSPSPTTGANLATCIWTSRHAAIEASKLPLHRKAAQYAAPSYQRYDLIRYKVVKLPGEARLRIEEWTAQDDRDEDL